MATVGWFLSPEFTRRVQLRARDRAAANAGQIGVCLKDFDNIYGKFPDGSTALEVRQKTGTLLTLGGDTSNEFFAQLFGAGMAKTERIFYADAKLMQDPDEQWDYDATVLARRECGFAYIAGLSAKSEPDTPVVFGPVIPGTRSLDPDSCGGYAVVLNVDGSVHTYKLNPKRKPVLPNGLELLNPSQTFWHGTAPDVKWPK